MDQPALASVRQALTHPDWHHCTVEQALERLCTGYSGGLSSQDAAERLSEFGPNELREVPRPSFWSRLLNQFRGFLVMILLVASVISFLLGDYIETAAIVAIIVLNALLGVVQETRAEEALAALKKMAAPEAKVVRDGRQISVPTRELVPGDVVLLETGNYIPADIRLLEAVNLKVQEASLTGESLPVEKRANVVFDREIPLGDRSNSAYMGTMVTYGRGRGVVTSTGMRTQLGLIANLIQNFDVEPTPLQRKLDRLGRTLGIVALALCGVVFLVSVLRYLLDPPAGTALTESILDMFLVAVSLAIAAVPEGLPAVVTICLALGVQRMIKRHALLRQLPAVETLGSATVICSDKTGTLTQNAMTVVRIWASGTLLQVDGDGLVPEGEFRDGDEPVDLSRMPEARFLLLSGLLCNDAYIETSGAEAGKLTWRLVGDPTESALVVAAAKAGYWREASCDDLPRVAELPFDSDRKRMTTIHALRGSQFMSHYPGLDGHSPPDSLLIVVKGAPDVVLSLCTHQYRDGRVVPMTEADRRRILGVVAELSSEALRVLAASFKTLAGTGRELSHASFAEPVVVPAAIMAGAEQNLVFTGLWGMIDPARPEVKAAINTARNAGIKSVMITGDYPNTAVAIAREIGLLRRGGLVMSGRDLDELDDGAFSRCVDDVDVYARVSPQHKLRIVEALRARGHIVAMTGDGVNDAPALKRADIGVAMGITGTDVSKETAAMVLTDDNYASIVSAVEEGRVIYSNIRKFVYFLLSCNVSEILVVLLAALFGWPLPLVAIQLLVLNLLSDGAPALALGLEKGEPDIMARRPRRPDEPVINREMVWRILIQAVVDTVVILGVFRIGLLWYGVDLRHAQTMAFTALSISELLRAYTARSEHYFVWEVGVWSNKYMHYAVASSLVVVLAIIFAPFFNTVFDTVFLTARDWLAIAPAILIPAIASELSKIPFRSRVEPGARAGR